VDERVEEMGDWYDTLQVFERGCAHFITLLSILTWLGF